jgi:VanZ family protein
MVSRGYAIVLLLVTVFIVYGSLFPFEYRQRTAPGGSLAYLLSTWRSWDRRGDLLANILLYLPFGFFGACALPSRMAALLRALLVTIAGTILACSVEIIQFHDVGRVTSMGDVYADAIGSGMGGLAAALIGRSVRWPLVRDLVADRAAALLLVMFFGYRLYPYVPVIDLHKYWHAVRSILEVQSLSADELTRYLITWLFIAVIVQSLYGFRRFLLLFPLLCGCEFLGRMVIVDQTLKPTDIIAAILAFLLWVVVARRISGRSAMMAIAFAGMIAAQRLQPFQFSGPTHSFGWVPFGSFLRGSIGVAVQAFCEKFYEYGGLIWLLGRAGMALPIGTALTATLLLVTSYAECWLPGRSAEVTDAVMALVIGAAFGLLRHPDPGLLMLPTSPDGGRAHDGA